MILRVLVLCLGALSLCQAAAVASSVFAFGPRGLVYADCCWQNKKGPAIPTNTKRQTQRHLKQSPAAEVVPDTIRLWETPLFEENSAQKTLVVLRSTWRVTTDSVEYDGWIPTPHQPHSDALLWRGSKQRTVLSCVDDSSSPAANALTVNASNVVFKGIQFQTCSQDGVAAVILEDSAVNVSFVDCVFTRNSKGGAIHVKHGAKVKLQDVLVHNHTYQQTNPLGTAEEGQGSAIRTSGELRISQSAFSNNTGAVDGTYAAGSVIVLPGGWLIATNTTFESNRAGIGAGISLGTLSGQARANISGCVFINNSCSFGGCGLHMHSGSSAVVRDSKFIGNFGYLDNVQGGGIKGLDNVDLLLYNTTILGNRAQYGAGVMLLGASGSGADNCPSSLFNATSTTLGNFSRLAVESTVFIENSSEQGGGAMMVACTHLSLTDSMFRNNDASVGAAVLATNSSYLKATRCTFGNGTAMRTVGADILGAGAAIAAENNSRVDVFDGIFEYNSAKVGGAIALGTHLPNGTGQSHASIRGCTFNQNNCRYGGCAVWLQQNSTVAAYDSTFDGGEANETSWKGGGAAMFATASSLLDISNCSFKNLRADSGGAIRLQENSRLEVRHSIFESNFATVGSGFSLREQSSATVENCTFRQNNCKYGGCAIWLETNSSLATSNSWFLGGTALEFTWHGGGGGVFATTSSIIGISNCSFTELHGDSGGAVLLDQASEGSITDSDFFNCSSAAGGAIAQKDRTRLTVERSSFTDNSAKSTGGAMLVTTNAQLLLYNSTFVRNQAVDWSGGAFLVQQGSKVEMHGSTFIGNTAHNESGALHVQEFATITIVDCHFQENTAGAEAGVGFFVKESVAVLINSTFVNNSAGQQGGALQLSNVNITIDDCKFYGNRAEQDGGVINLWRALAEAPLVAIVKNSVFINNTAQRGAVFKMGGGHFDLNVINCNMTNNYARHQGGAMWSEPYVAWPMRPKLYTTLRGCYVAHNVAPFGGGLHINDQEVVTIEDSQLIGNRGFVNGGAIVVESGGMLVMRNSTLESNEASSYGGAIYMQGTSTAKMTNVVFEDNHAQVGGAIAQVAASSSVSLDSCTLTGNAARLYGGAVHSAGDLNISTSAFDNHWAPSAGGALHLVSTTRLLLQSSIFYNNSAAFGGSIHSAGSGTVRTCNFTNDKASQQGGSIYVHSKTISIENSSIVGSIAEVMGGAVTVAAGARVQVADSRMSNARSSKGGAVAVLGAADFAPAITAPSRDILPNRRLLAAHTDLNTMGSYTCLLEHHQAHTGGAVFVGPEASLYMKACQFQGSTADEGEGGAIFTSTKSNATLVGCRFINNNATTDGGALHVMGTALLSASTLSGNHAGRNGGGVDCNGCALLTVEMLAADNNVAGAEGGAVWLSPNDHAELIDSSLSSNTAPKGGGLYLKSQSCLHADVTLPCISVRNTRVENNTAGGIEGRGGGLYALASSFILLDGVMVEKNAARMGGGLFLNTTGCVSVNSDGAGNPGCLQMHNVTTRSNDEPSLGIPGTDEQKHGSSIFGPDIFVTKPEFVRVKCNSLDNPELLELVTQEGSSLPGSCLLGLNKSTVASAAHTLKILPGWTGSDVASRQPLGIHLQVLDMYSQPLGLVDDARADFEVQLSTDNSSAQLLGAKLISGELNSNVSFSDLQMLADPGDYTLNFTTRRSDLGLAPATLKVRVRHCPVGEAAGNQECIKCGHSDQFSLDLQSARCTRCPTGGNCSTGWLLPQDGYWISHMRSSHPHACLYEGACKYAGRSAKLTLLQNATQMLPSKNISAGVVQFYQQHQCAEEEGYTGTLCATCKKSYGRNGPYCRLCRTKVQDGWALAAIILAQALIVTAQFVIFNLSAQAFQVRAKVMKTVLLEAEPATEAPLGNFSRNASRRDVHSQTSGRIANSEADKQGAGVLTEFKFPSFTSNCSSEGGPNTSRARDQQIPDMQHLGVCNVTCEAKEKATEGTLLHKGNNSLQHALARRDDDKQAAALTGNPMDTAVHEVNDQVGKLPRQGEKRQELTELATGTLKILVEYMQLLGILRSLRVPMPINVRDFLSALDVTSASTNQTLYCSLSGSAALRMLAIPVFTLLLPLAFIVATPPLLAACHWLSSFWPRSAWRHSDIPRRSFVISIFVLLFFFPNVCRQLLLLFSFIRLDRQDGAPVAGAVSWAEGWFWLQLPDLKYFKGAHMVVALAVGVPGLLAYAVVLPILLAMMLLRHREQLDEPQVHSWYGMLYNDYALSRYYWQSVVLSMQLLLIMCVVLLNSVGTAVQLLTALVLVVCYQYLTAMAQPYRHRPLQHLARTMLLAVILTLVLLLFLVAVEHPSHRKAVVVLLLLLNVIVVALLLGYIGLVLWRVWPMLDMTDFLSRTRRWQPSLFRSAIFRRAETQSRKAPLKPNQSIELVSADSAADTNALAVVPSSTAPDVALEADANIPSSGPTHLAAHVNLPDEHSVTTSRDTAQVDALHFDGRQLQRTHRVQRGAVDGITV